MIQQGIIESVDQAIFDTVYLPPKGNRVMAFTMAFGQQVLSDEGWKVKDWTDTNMLQAGMLDAPKKMEVNSIDCYLASPNGIVPATSRWYAEMALELSVSRKTMWHGPLTKCINPVAILDRDLMWNKLLTKDDILELKEKFAPPPLEKPILIDQQECFNVVCTLSSWACEQYEKRWSFLQRKSMPHKLAIFLNGTLWRAVC
jgi:hypothetical protein